jgi:predicted amidohydrolase YtcJ
MLKKLTRFGIILSTLLMLGACFKGQEADLIIHNAKIHSLDSENTIYAAMAIKDGKIIDLGPEREILNKYSGTSYDAEKKSIFPGFIDGHAHYSGAAKNALMSSLFQTKTKQDIIDKTNVYDSKKSHGWILGRGWNQETLPNKSMLSKKELDSIYPNNPVLLIRIDGHAGVANSLAMKKSGLDTITNLSGGRIFENGLILDNALNIVLNSVPEFEESLILSELIKIQEDLLQYGIVGLHDAGINQKDLSRYHEMEKSGALKISLNVMLSNNEENIQYFIDQGKTKTDRVKVQSIKCYVDGALGSRGACLKENYNDQDTKGFILMKEEKLNKVAQFCIENDIQLNTHCIGDSAFSWVCNTFSKYLKKGNDRRWRIEHAQVVDPVDLKTMKDYGIIPSVQPCHAISDMNWVHDRIGTRDTFSYNYRALKNHANFIISGTDFPIESPNPFVNFFAGTKRQFLDLTPVNGFQRAGALSKMEMLKSMTYWPALGSFSESSTGSLELHKKADFIILNQNILDCPDEKFNLTYVTKTFINGKEVYSIE